MGILEGRGGSGLAQHICTSVSVSGWYVRINRPWLICSPEKVRVTHFQLLLRTPSEHTFVVLHWDEVNMKKWPPSPPSSFLYNSRSNFNVNSNSENKLMLNIDAPWTYLLHFPWVAKYRFFFFKSWHRRKEMDNSFRQFWISILTKAFMCYKCFIDSILLVKQF